jgi:hypothetical protein
MPRNNGKRRALHANGPEALCWSHDPKNAEKRRRIASKGLREVSEGSSMGVWERTVQDDQARPISV